jgi:outer membrane protein assembly factor BamB
MSALDAATGKEVWSTSYPAAFTPMKAAARHGSGPKSTPVYFKGRLYSIGMTGIVTAFDAASGKQLWQKPGSTVVPQYTTHAFSPIVEGAMVIFHIGGHDQGALTAFDLATGDVKWSWNGDGPAYASPIVVSLGGTRQVVTMTQKNIVGVSAATGELLWQRPFVSKFQDNSITPTLYGQTIIVSGTEMGVTAFTVANRTNKWVTDDVWKNEDVALSLSNGVLVGDTLYGMSHRASGQLFALDAKSGKTLWKGDPRLATNVAMVKSGDLLFVLKDDAELMVARANPAAFEPLKRYKVAESATWAQPTLSGNRIFVKDVSTLALWTVN